MPQIEIGDAVLPRNKPDADVMTVYDLQRQYTEALCNWVVGTRMYRAAYHVNELIPVARAPRKKAK